MKVDILPPGQDERDARVAARLIEARNCKAMGYYDRAIQGFISVLVIDEHNLESLVSLSEIYKERGNSRLAEKYRRHADIAVNTQSCQVQRDIVSQNRTSPLSRPTPLRPEVAAPKIITGSVGSTTKEEIDPVEDARIMKLLPHTWQTFFGRFGSLRSIQRNAVPVVLAGKNAMLISPTASGKTEAVLAPLIERLIAERWPGLSIVYISPTKALVNDLKQRLETLLAPLDLTVAQRDGDVKDLSTDRPQNILVTTPESLDSMIVWKKSSLRGVRAIVIDELHLMDGNYRGDQLRVLLRRMQMDAGSKFMTFALSATVSDPEVMAQRYMDDAQIIQIGGGRGIDYRIVPTLDDAMIEIKRMERVKALVFCNTPTEAEEVAVGEGIKHFEAEVLRVHHGKLAKEPRMEAEEFLRCSDRTVCICTSTLEVGVDIGDIDIVVLAKVPRSISALAQRIGRGNRRADRISVIAVGRTEGEAAYYQSLFATMMLSRYEVTEYRFDISVAAQQILSAACTLPIVLRRREYYHDLMDGICIKENVDDIITYLKDGGFMIEEDGRLIRGDGTAVLDTKLFSNIPQASSINVVEQRSRRSIGRVDAPVDNVFVLSGKAWMVAERKDDHVFVVPMSASTTIAKFATYERNGAYYDMLPSNLKKCSSV